MQYLFTIYAGIPGDRPRYALATSRIAEEVAKVANHFARLTVTKAKGYYDGKFERTLRIHIATNGFDLIVQTAQMLREYLEQEAIGIEVCGRYFRVTKETENAHLADEMRAARPMTTNVESGETSQSTQHENVIAGACRKCGGEMRSSKALKSTWVTGIDDLGGPGTTMHPGGPGKMIDVMKCKKCGHSVSLSSPKLINHTELFKAVLDGRMNLSNDQDATHWSSWKAGGQEFDIYAVLVEG